MFHDQRHFCLMAMVLLLSLTAKAQQSMFYDNNLNDSNSNYYDNSNQLTAAAANAPTVPTAPSPILPSLVEFVPPEDAAEYSGGVTTSQSIAVSIAVMFTVIIGLVVILFCFISPSGSSSSSSSLMYTRRRDRKSSTTFKTSTASALPYLDDHSDNRPSHGGNNIDELHADTRQLELAIEAAIVDMYNE